MPSRRDQAQDTREHAYALLRRTAAADAQLDLAELYEEARSHAASS